MTYAVSPSTKIITVILNDVVTLEDCVQPFTSLLAQSIFQPGMQMLVDATGIRPRLSSADLRALVSDARKLLDAGISSIAVVASSDFVYGLARAFSIYADIEGLKAA